MQVLIGILVIAVLALSIGRLMQQRGRTRRQRADRGKPLEIGTEIPTFNLIALGGKETGKTVLLASMFHLLNTEMEDGRFRLQTSLEQSVQLADLYHTLVSPKPEDWPPGTKTGDIRSFTFECIGSAGGDEFPILNFNYLDFAGELLGGSGAQQEGLELREGWKDLEQRVEAAHALFGIIDGRLMLACLHGDPEGESYMENSITPMIGVMRKAKCPIHFILTKWDLFDDKTASDEVMDEDERLAEVRRRLLSQDQIRNLVERRKLEKRIVRLIPLSAIGRQFATPDAEGHMVKRKSGRRLRPINIEIPLCSVLPDLFGQIEEQLDQASEQKIMAERRARARLTPKESLAAVGKFLALPAGVALRTAADIAIGRTAFSDRIADMFIDWVGRPFDDKMADVDAAVDDAWLRLRELKLARQAVLQEFSERMIVLKRQLPASDLTGGSRP